MITGMSRPSRSHVEGSCFHKCENKSLVKSWKACGATCNVKIPWDCYMASHKCSKCVCACCECVKSKLICPIWYCFTSIHLSIHPSLPPLYVLSPFPTHLAVLSHVAVVSYSFTTHHFWAFRFLIKLTHLQSSNHRPLIQRSQLKKHLINQKCM